MPKKDDLGNIRVCLKCGHPILFTLIFPNAYRYCTHCGNKADLCAFKEIPATLELLEKYKQSRLAFDKLAPFIKSASSRVKGCPKCFPCDYSKGEDHNKHLLSEEIEKEAWVLKKLYGLLSQEFRV